MNTSRYLSIVKNLIAKSFPRLQNKRIRVFRFNFPVSEAAALWVLPWYRIILVSPKCDTLSAPALTGLLVHELCHHDMAAEQGSWIRYLLTKPFLYAFSPRSVIKEERATDTRVIEKGYGRELYELTEILSHDSKRKQIDKNYLTKEQVREYAEMIHKW
jgi:hypothetical protein